MNDTPEKKILLAHGGGGRLSNRLIADTIVPKFQNDILSQLGDAASLELCSRSICFTTDSFVVKPLFFNGGDIGKLAVCGTINDLAVAGGKPAALSLSLIIAEGLALETLDKILSSAAETAAEAGVPIVTGDTKVVETDAADEIFINTAGIGTKLPGVDLSADRITAGDKIIINGTIGDHGMAVMSLREGIKFDSPLKSDCACLNGLISGILEKTPDVKFMRDPTRGGVAATLNEIAVSCGCDIEIVEADIPVNPTAYAAAEMLGFDLLNIANEGKVLLIVPADSAQTVVETCRNHPLGKDACVIGCVGQRTKAANVPIVELVTRIGGRRVVQMPYGRELPRIC